MTRFLENVENGCYLLRTNAVNAGIAALGADGSTSTLKWPMLAVLDVLDSTAPLPEISRAAENHT